MDPKSLRRPPPAFPLKLPRREGDNVSEIIKLIRCLLGMITMMMVTITITRVAGLVRVVKVVNDMVMVNVKV